MPGQHSTSKIPTTELAPAEILLALDSAYPDDEVDENVQSSVTSISSSILEYRRINGRTYHSFRCHEEYFTPNDQQHQESLDIAHHYNTLLLDGRLFLAPIPSDVKVGSPFPCDPTWITLRLILPSVCLMLEPVPASGPCNAPLCCKPSLTLLTKPASDFADAYPDAQVIGTDLSPMQPSWIPQNLKFEVDDATLPWTWRDNTFDFIHSRSLIGAIIDWKAFFQEQYRCCKPGGWIESVEIDPIFLSDDGTVDSCPVLARWNDMYREAGLKTGRSFTIVADGVQKKGVEEAGFMDIKVVTMKIPMGGWPLDPKLKQVGRVVQLTMETDIEGYTTLLWHNILKWPAEEYPVFLQSVQAAVRSRRIHGYMLFRCVYGRKPDAA